MNIALSNIVGMQGILLLVYVSALMFVMRHFAGPIVKRISSVGLMFVSCVAAGVGLYPVKPRDNAPYSPLPLQLYGEWASATCGLPCWLLCRNAFPEGAQSRWGLMGFAGGMAIQFVLPKMGAIFDTAKAQAAGGADKLAGLSPQAMDEVIRYASVESFQSVAIVPLLLLPVFGIIWLYDRKKGLYQSGASADSEAS